MPSCMMLGMSVQEFNCWSRATPIAARGNNAFSEDGDKFKGKDRQIMVVGER